MIDRIPFCLELLIYYYLICRVYGEKFKFDIVTILFFSFDIAGLCAMNDGIIPEKSLAIIYIGMLLYGKIRFKVRLSKNIAGFLSSIMIIGVLELLISILFVAVTNSMLNKNVIAIIVQCLVLLIIYLVGKKKKLNIYVGAIYNKLREYKVIAAAFLVIIVFETLAFKYVRTITVLQAMVFAGMIMLVSVILLLWQKQNSEMKVKMESMKMQQVYGNAFESMITDIRRKQHDFDNHINAIYGLHRTAKSFDELIKRQEEYCEHISDNKYSKMFNEKSSPVIIGFLYSKFCSANKEGISVEPHIVIEEANCNISQYEIIQIIGSLFDNAVEAVREKDVSLRRIRISMIEYSEKIEIKVMNLSDYMKREKMQKLFQLGYSTKGENRGIGLNNIKDIMEKSKNEMIVENINVNEENYFSIKLVIKK